jgi:hypothetical protein
MRRVHASILAKFLCRPLRLMKSIPGHTSACSNLIKSAHSNSRLGMCRLAGANEGRRPGLLLAQCTLFIILHVIGTRVKRRNNTSKLTANPLALWTGLAIKTGEMALASAQVIVHRTNRIAAAGLSPNSRDRREFALMGQEKMAAASESTQAIAARMFKLSQQMSTTAVNHLVASMAAGVSLTTARTLAQSTRLQAEFIRGMMSGSAATGVQIAESVARVAHHGLKPIHSRATANAKRLARHKK